MTELINMEAAGWLEEVRAQERRGEPLSAFDLAERGLAEHPENVGLRYRAVLSLARAGATDEAAHRYVGFGLDGVADEDVAALGARISKDRALALSGPGAVDAAAEAARRYARVYESFGGYYPAVNAATMWLVAEQDSRSRALAREALGLVRDAASEDYYALATRGEALLLLGRLAEAGEALASARAAHRDDHGAMASTRRQLRLICRLKGIEESVLEPLTGPQVAHFCGHIVAAAGETGRFLASQEDDVRRAVQAAVRQRDVAFAYGALAAGADIMWAEALLDAGAELHIVLPFAAAEFIAVSVAPAGQEWVKRFEACLGAAAEVVLATDGRYLGDDSLFRYGAELAMGLALTRARHLASEAIQLAVWDQEPAAAGAGTAVDIERWRQRDERSTIVVPIASGDSGQSSQATPAAEPPRGRVVRAMLFGDIKGFSRLTDDQLPTFAENILGLFARVITTYTGVVEHANTWGDAVYLVIRDPTSAAELALSLQDQMRSLDLLHLGLPADLALRLAGHVGPVFPIIDPVLDRLAFMGAHVSRTARIEPITPPGETYVTDAFAAALALTGPPHLACDYVGHLPTAKDYGLLRMHRLRQRTLVGQSAVPTPSDQTIDLNHEDDRSPSQGCR